MNTNSPVLNMVKIIALFVVGGILLSTVLGLLSGILWLAVKLLVPVAIAVWLVRLITEPKKSKHYY